MAANLVRAGFEVTVWNRTPDKCDPLVALGARQGRPREVAAACDITFAMLADPAAAREVFFGADGLGEGLGEGRGYVDMSTVDEATAREISAAVTQAGRAVSGGPGLRDEEAGRGRDTDHPHRRRPEPL